MTISVASLFTPTQSVTVAASRTSPSFSPTAGSVCFISGYCREDVGSSAAPVVTIGNTHAGSWSWSSLTRGNTQTQRRRSFAFWSLVPSSPGSGTATITADKDCDEWVLSGWECSGADAAITNTDASTTTSTTISGSVPTTPAATSLVFGTCFSSTDSDGLTTGSGYTQLFSVTPGVIGSSYHVQHTSGAPSRTMTWGSGSTSHIWLAWELTASPDTGFAPALLRRSRRGRRLAPAMFTD